MFPGGRNGQLPHATERQRKMRTEKDTLNCLFFSFGLIQLAFIRNSLCIK